MVYHGHGLAPWADDHVRGTFIDLRESVTAAIRTVEPHVEDFDTIVVQGVSGMSIGFPLALALGVDIVVVRKAGEDNHSSKKTAGVYLGGRRCLFVDDFVSGGTTKERVRAEVNRERGLMVAQYTSREDEYRTLL
jgi:adenine/guanine phosphoribosyltransferase-like PRPP-binding protein